MRFALVADVFPPSRSSGAVQLRDLALEFVNQGHGVSVLVAEPELDTPWRMDSYKGVQVLRLRSPRTKDVGHLRRALGELLMPFAMRRNWRRSPLARTKWDGVIWYSPTIFLGPIVSAIKASSGCRSYLIIRDIFPEWASDVGLMRRGAPYLFFKAVASYQYSVADVIGVQTHGNRHYFRAWLDHGLRRLEVLQNWLAEAPIAACSVSVEKTVLAGRRIFVYAGNMGIAQGMDILLELADQMKARSDVGFLFVGRGSEALRLRKRAEAGRLENVAFFDEIDPDEIPGLYAQCDVGLVTLDPRHRSHNIPGKFLSYLQAGLPVLAAVNPGNDIAELIATEGVGRVCTDGSAGTLKIMAEQLLQEIDSKAGYAVRCKSLFRRLFAPSVAVAQIVTALRP